MFWHQIITPNFLKNFLKCNDNKYNKQVHYLTEYVLTLIINHRAYMPLHHFTFKIYAIRQRGSICVAIFFDEKFLLLSLR